MTHVIEALGTSDLLEANYRKKQRIAAIAVEFRRRRCEASGGLPAEIDEARALRMDPRTTPTDAEEDGFHESLSILVDRILPDDPDHRTVALQDRANTVIRIAQGAHTLREWLEIWRNNSGVKVRTKAKYATAIVEFLDFLGVNDCLPEKMDRKAAREYASWLNREGKSQRTKAVVPLSFKAKEDRIAVLKSFWNYLCHHEAVGGLNPWTGHHITERPTSDENLWDSMGNTGRPKKRDYLRDDDIIAILKAPGPRPTGATKHTKLELIEVFAMALLTGARPEELCSRTLADIRAADGGYWLRITDSKNAASDREIPITHPIAVGLLKRLTGDRTDKRSRLFAQLEPSKTDGTYSRAIGKALQRLFKTVPGLADGIVPYCTRHTLQSIMNRPVF